MDKKRSTISSAWLRIKSILIMLGVIYILGCMIMPTERKIRYYQTEEEVEHERFLDSLMRESIDEKEVEVTVTVYNPVAENVELYALLYSEYKLLHDYFGKGGNDVMKRLRGKI